MSFRTLIGHKTKAADSNSIGRRAFIKGLATTTNVALAIWSSKALANSEVNVTSPPFNAKPNSTQDSSAAFQAALNYLANAGGGVLYIPPGVYLLQNPLSYSGQSLTIIGGGQEVSVLVVMHGGTGVTVNLSSVVSSLTVHDIGIAPVPGGSALSAGAIACLLQWNDAGWQNCLIKNCDFGASYEQNCSAFSQAVVLQNTWRARIENCNCHGNIAQGGTFLSIQGHCIDTRVSSCSIDQYTQGVAVSSYCEGLHVTEMLFDGGTAIFTGSTAYNGPTNLLGLYVKGCEFNCSNPAMVLYQVNSGWISDTFINGPVGRTGNAACVLSGTRRLTMSHVLFKGSFGQISNEIGLFATSSGSLNGGPTGACQMNDCQFENTGTALFLDSGTYNFIASALAVYQPGNGALVNLPLTFSSGTQKVFVDNSGNTTNEVNWFTTNNIVPRAKTTRSSFEH